MPRGLGFGLVFIPPGVRLAFLGAILDLVWSFWGPFRFGLIWVLYVWPFLGPFYRMGWPF